MKTILSFAMVGVACAHAADVTGTARLAGGRIAGQSVIWLEGAAKSKPLPKFVVDQRDRAFVPHISVVTAGTKIDFPNNDFVYHNVFAEYDAKKFDLGMYPRGSKKEVRFDKPGLVALLCSVHSEMSAYVMVVDTPYYAISNKKGGFTIPNVAPGEYTLKAWHESGQKVVQKVKVTASGLKIDPELSRK